MAEKYLLRVTTGSSYDPAHHEVVPINSPRPISIESEHISVNLNVRIQSFRGIPLSSPSTSSYFSLPPHDKNNDQYSISFSFILKSNITGNNLIFGNDFEHPIRDRLPPGFNTAFRIVKWFIDPGLEGDVYADKPYLYGSLASSINILYIGNKDKVSLDKEHEDPGAGLLFTEGGSDDGISLRKLNGIPDSAGLRKKHFLQLANRNNWEWEAGRQYGCDFFNPYLDFNELALRLPGFTLPIMKYWDGQNLRLVSSSNPSNYFLAHIAEAPLTITLLYRNTKGKEDKVSHTTKPKRSHTLRYTLKNRATDTVLFVVVFTLYLKEDVDEHGVLKESVKFLD